MRSILLLEQITCSRNKKCEVNCSWNKFLVPGTRNVKYIAPGTRNEFVPGTKNVKYIAPGTSNLFQEQKMRSNLLLEQAYMLLEQSVMESKKKVNLFQETEMLLEHL